MRTTEDVVVVASEPVAPVAAVPSGPLTVTVPPTAKGGDTIAVEMPDGQKMNVVVPAGLTAGQPFQVQPSQAKPRGARPIAVARTSTGQAATNAAVAANYAAGLAAAQAQQDAKVAEAEFRNQVEEDVIGITLGIDADGNFESPGRRFERKMRLCSYICPTC